ncbi:ArsA-related P-loop ATPase [Streptomyces sp. DW26H14]|uniref:ArsA-related P-loop ATPase n=1 Tax=Streptomyces sp. DW26H14 TaxID=3435395 RepID=UPI00403DA32D
MSKAQGPGAERDDGGEAGSGLPTDLDAVLDADIAIDSDSDGDDDAIGAASAGTGTARGRTRGRAEPSPERAGLPSDTPALDVDALLDDRATRIIVCCGSGGVGKTTTAAALGVRAAERGRKVVVLTIDPARRLAQSMGIDSLDNTPRQVKGVEGPGELHAMMLDMKRTFDEIVESHADKARARAILENPFYQSLSAGFAGTQEYMAMEKLGQLRARDEWDLIVVDTPPSRSALDFLDAPKRLGSFLDGKFIRLLMAPAKVGGRAGMKFLNVGMSMMTGTLGKLLGGQFLNDVQTFVAAMDTMFGGFRTRADATYRLLQAPGTAFLVVAAPERDALREAAYFVRRLAAERMPLAGLVLNRVHDSGARRLSADRARAAAENLEETGIVDQEPGNGVSGATPRGATNGAAAPGTASSPEATGPSEHPESPDAHQADSPVSPDSSDSSAADTVTSVEQLTAGLLRLHADRMHVIAREQRTRDRFTALHPEVAVIAVPALPGDVHDLVGLRAVGDRLAAADTSA